MILLESVSKTYEMGEGVVRALDHVDLQVDQGDFLAIVGPSGSGKSTLMNILGLLDVPDEGRYLLDGMDVGALSDNRLASIRNEKIGFVFQSFNLLGKLTALENVKLPLSYAGVRLKEADARARKQLALVGLEGREHHLPNQLSGGQQQRVAIARALITKPKLVFADEPTGNLDSVSSAEVLGFLKRSVNELGQTIVMVTHDAVAASYADRAIVFSDGRIVADEQHPNAEVMNELLMAERERTTRTTLTDTPADQMAQMAGVRNVPDLPITDAPLPPAVPTSGREGTLRYARAAARHAR